MNVLCQLPKIDRHHPRNALLYHGYTVNNIGTGHRSLVMSDNDELGVFAKGPDDLVELVDVGIVKGRIYFIENTERGRLEQVRSEEHTSELQSRMH